MKGEGEGGREGEREKEGKGREGGREGEGNSPLLRIISNHTHEEAPRNNHGLARTVQHRRSRYTTRKNISRAKICAGGHIHVR